MAYRLLDVAILAISVLFFVGVLAFEYSLVGLSSPVIQLSSDWKFFFDMLVYPIVILLVADLVLKYRKVNSLQTFAKKYWVDIVMIGFIPIFSIFKFFKVGVGLVKQLKTAKMGAKALHKTKKIAKK